jgi:hypothetical protein
MANVSRISTNMLQYAVHTSVFLGLSRESEVCEHKV